MILSANLFLLISSKNNPFKIRAKNFCPFTGEISHYYFLSANKEYYKVLRIVNYATLDVVE